MDDKELVMAAEKLHMVYSDVCGEVEEAVYRTMHWMVYGALVSEVHEVVVGAVREMVDKDINEMVRRAVAGALKEECTGND